MSAYVFGMFICTPTTLKWRWKGICIVEIEYVRVRIWARCWVIQQENEMIHKAMYLFVHNERWVHRTPFRICERMTMLPTEYVWVYSYWYIFCIAWSQTLWHLVLLLRLLVMFVVVLLIFMMLFNLYDFTFLLRLLFNWESEREWKMIEKSIVWALLRKWKLCIEELPSHAQSMDISGKSVNNDHRKDKL